MAASTALMRAQRLGHQVTPEIVQRTLKRWKPKGGVAEEYEKVDAKVQEVDAAVDGAYDKVAQQLKDGEVEQLDGVSNRRFAYWVAGMQDKYGPVNLKAAATGYIIEDHATSGFSDDPMVDLQVTGELRNTRPDVVVRDSSQGLFGVTGYLDITSTGDAGHIFDKEGNWGRRPYVAESLYPSIDFSDLAKGPLKVDEDTLRKVEEWRMMRAQRAWKRAKKAYQSRKASFERDQAGVVRILEGWSVEKRRRLRPPEPERGGSGGKVRRPRSRQTSGPYSQRPSRVETKMLADMKEYAVQVGRDGSVHPLDFEDVLDAQGIAYTWEHIQELYALT